MNLEGRVALVTGASQGIGRACAHVLAEAGADIALAARTLLKLECVTKEIQDLGRKALVLELDVASRDSIAASIARVLREWGKIDILVNNAGMTKDNLAMRLKHEDREVAYGVRFLASEEAGYITGHVLNINGGMFMA